jgi:hypothetical protein
MKTISMRSFLPFAMFAAGAAAQAADLAGQRRVRVRAPVADVAVVLLAVDDTVVPLMDQWLLADAIVLPLAPANGDVADFFAPTIDADLWYQVVVCKNGLAAADVYRLPAVLDADRAPIDDVFDGAIDSLPPITLTPNQHCGRIDGLKVGFEAPSDGYGLRLIAVDEAEPGTLDVHLWRKLPGPGEGHLDLVETHRLSLQFAPVRRLRVFVADSIGRPRHGEERLVATFPR